MNKEKRLSEVEEEFVALFVEARKRFERAELDYMAFLHDAERTQRPKWSALASSFEDFIRRYVGKPELSKYANYKGAVKELGLEKVETIGLEAAVEETRLKGESRKKFDVAAVLWTKEQAGRHMSGFEAERIRQQVAPKEVVPMPVRRNEELESLRRENVELRKENARLRKQVAELQKKKVA